MDLKFFHKHTDNDFRNVVDEIYAKDGEAIIDWSTAINVNIETYPELYQIKPNLFCDNDPSFIFKVTVNMVDLFFAFYSSYHKTAYRDHSIDNQDFRNIIERGFVKKGVNKVSIDELPKVAVDPVKLNTINKSKIAFVYFPLNTSFDCIVNCNNDKFLQLIFERFVFAYDKYKENELNIISITKQIEYYQRANAELVTKNELYAKNLINNNNNEISKLTEKLAIVEKGNQNINIIDIEKKLRILSIKLSSVYKLDHDNLLIIHKTEHDNFLVQQKTKHDELLAQHEKEKQKFDDDHNKMLAELNDKKNKELNKISNLQQIIDKFINS